MRVWTAGPLALAAASAAAQDMPADQCLPAPFETPVTRAQNQVAGLVDEMRGALQDFPTLREALETPALSICLVGGLADASGFFAPSETRIVLHESLSDDMRRVVLVHELRHLDQNAHGVCPGLSLSRESYAQAVFAMEADASAITALVTWSWHTAGKPGPWQALADWPGQADVAARFKASIDAGASHWLAVSMAFEQWYLNAERRDGYWFSACSNYLDQQDATDSLPEYGDLDSVFWADLCVLPNGRAYKCHAVR